MEQEVIDRFFDKVALPAHLHDCWEWAASVNKGGYGYFGFEDKSQRAHRVSWTIRQMAGYTVSTLEDGIKAARHLLCPSI